MPINYDAWSAPATFANTLIQGLKEQQARQMMMNKNLQAQDAQDALEISRLSGINTPEAKALIDAKTAAMQGRHAIQPQPVKPFKGIIPLLGDIGKGAVELFTGPQTQSEEVKTEAPQGGMAPEPLQTSKSANSSLPPIEQGPTMPKSPKPDSGMSLKDESALARQMALDKERAKNKVVANSGIPRGLATILRASGMTQQEANRYDSLPSAVNIHNQIVDAINAYSSNNQSVAKSTVDHYISQHPALSGYFQGYKANPNNQAALYDALTRMGAIEQFKLQLGSQAMPTEEAVIHNQQMYPSLQEIAAKSPVVSQKLNSLVDTTINPAIDGVMGRMSLLKDKKTGMYPAPVIGTIAENLESQRQQLHQKIKGLPGYQMQEGMMQIPPEQSGLPAEGETKPKGRIISVQ